MSAWWADWLVSRKIRHLVDVRKTYERRVKDVLQICKNKCKTWKFGLIKELRYPHRFLYWITDFYVFHLFLYIWGTSFARLSHVFRTSLTSFTRLCVKLLMHLMLYRPLQAFFNMYFFSEPFRFLFKARMWNIHINVWKTWKTCERHVKDVWKTYLKWTKTNERRGNL